MEAARPSKTLVFYDITTWCYNPEEHDIYKVHWYKMMRFSIYKQNIDFTVKINSTINVWCT